MANTLNRRLGRERDAAFVTVTNATAETTMYSLALEPKQIDKRHGFRLSALVKIPSQNSTDTFALKAKVGATALATVAAFDAADNDCCFVEVTGTFDPRAALLHAVGVSGRTGQSLAVPTLTADLATAFSAAVTLSITGQWSVAHADNVAILKHVSLEWFPEDAT